MKNLFKKPQTEFDRRTVKSQGVNDIFAINLVDFAKQKGGYVMNCVDVFSRYAQSVKLKNKSKSELERGIHELIKLYGAKPKKIWCDLESGVQALEPHLNSMGIELYHTDNSYRGEGTHSVPIVERFNRTMKYWMYIYKQESEINMNWAQLLVLTIKKFIPFYNTRIHSSIGRTPEEAYTGKYNNELNAIQTTNENARKIEGQGFKIGQSVNLAKREDPFRSKTETNFHKKPFSITDIKPTNPTTYTLSGKGKTAYYGKQFL